MLVLVYRKCSTCIKALKWLEENAVSFTERPIVDENPTYDELKTWHQMSGLPLKKFFNTSGLLYKEMNLKDLYNESIFICNLCVCFFISFFVFIPIFYYNKCYSKYN